MRILFLTFYFEPDLCAGSFRNTPLFNELRNHLKDNDFIHVVTTMPNRYKSFKSKCDDMEQGSNYQINRISLPEHNSGMLDQAKAFMAFYRRARTITHNNQYDLVYASSSRLFTAFLGRRIAGVKNIPLYLDIRDIFVDTMKDVLNKKKLLQIPVVLFANLVERYTFGYASHINLVSEGFKPYFKKYKRPSFTYYTNGIDDVFINMPLENNATTHNPVIITYAGNIGSGQGLEKIIPLAAKELGDNYLFRIIGDGGTKKLLEDKIKELGVHNVEIINPVKRDELIKYYHQSTYLFLHLNDLEAFKKVLPSKIFEYGAFPKPIIAGVGGYAAEFIRDNLTNYILFQPTDVVSFVNQLRNFKPVFEKREEFALKFSRVNIIKMITESILSV